MGTVRRPTMPACRGEVSRCTIPAVNMAVSAIVDSTRAESTRRYQPGSGSPFSAMRKGAREWAAGGDPCGTGALAEPRDTQHEVDHGDREQSGQSEDHHRGRFVVAAKLLGHPPHDRPGTQLRGLPGLDVMSAAHEPMDPDRA